MFATLFEGINLQQLCFSKLELFCLRNVLFVFFKRIYDARKVKSIFFLIGEEGTNSFSCKFTNS